MNTECAWRDSLRLAIKTGIDNLDWVEDGCPAVAICDRLDELFASWIGHVVCGEQAPQRNHKPATGCRRVQYSELQHLYGRKKSACASKVLDGLWESINSDPGLHLSNSEWPGRTIDGRHALDR